MTTTKDRIVLWNHSWGGWLSAVRRTYRLTLRHLTQTNYYSNT